MYKSTVLCERTLEIITLSDSPTLDDLEKLMIQQDPAAMRGCLGKPLSSATDLCNRWIRIHWNDRFIGAMGIETANNTLSRLHFFLIGKNRQVARAVVAGVILHERFKGNSTSTKIPNTAEFEYMKNFLLNCDCAILASCEDAIFFKPSEFMNPSKFIRSFFTLPVSPTEEKEYP